MSDLIKRLRALADAHDRLEQGGRVSDKLAEAADRIEELEAALRGEIGERGYVSIYTDRVLLRQMLDENASIARRALGDGDECNHDWYRAVGSPPDICLKCQKLEDRG